MYTIIIIIVYMYIYLIGNGMLIQRGYAYGIGT